MNGLGCISMLIASVASVAYVMLVFPIAVDEIQTAVMDALYQRWKKCMPNEWLSPTLGQSEKLVQCYIEPKMTWKPGLGEIDLPLNRLQDIFTHLGAGTKRILVRGINSLYFQHSIFAWYTL